MNEGNAAAPVGGRSSDVGDTRLPAFPWQSVEADMRTIFGAARRSSGQMRARPLPNAPSRPARSGLRRLAVPLALLTCVAGAAAGLVVVVPLRQPPVSKTTPAFARHAAAPAMPMAGPTAMAVTDAPAFGARTTMPGWHALSTREASPAAPYTEAAPHEPAQAAPVVMAVASRPVEETRIGCNDDDDAGDAACSRAGVLEADRDLRDAYLRAVDAGVDRGRLIAIRNRWARLRATDYDRPDVLLAGYAELADRLDRATQFAGDDLR